MTRTIAMLDTLLKRTALAAALSMVAAATYAHHSFAMFNPQKPLEIAGTIRTFEFTNPHTYIAVDVPAGADVKHYRLEGPTPAILKRLGWNRSTLKPGDKVKFTIHPLRDGRPGGQARSVTLASGQVLSAVNEDTEYVK